MYYFALLVNGFILQCDKPIRLVHVDPEYYGDTPTNEGVLYDRFKNKCIIVSKFELRAEDGIGYWQSTESLASALWSELD